MKKIATLIHHLRGTFRRTAITAREFLAISPHSNRGPQKVPTFWGGVSIPAIESAFLSLCYLFRRISKPTQVGLIISFSLHLLCLLLVLFFTFTSWRDPDPQIIEMFVAPAPPSNELPTRLIAEAQREEIKQTKEGSATADKSQETEAKPKEILNQRHASPQEELEKAASKSQKVAAKKKQAPKEETLAVGKEKKKAAKKELKKIVAKKTTKSKKKGSSREPAQPQQQLSPPTAAPPSSSDTAVSANRAANAQARRRSLSLVGLQQQLRSGGKIVSEDEAAYIQCIKDQVAENWEVDSHTSNQPMGEAIIIVYIGIAGAIEKAELKASSGNPLYDRSALESIRRARPCPLPTTLSEEGVRKIGLAIYFP